MKKNLSFFKKHVFILGLVCAFASLFLFILGNFIELHPDAYFDLNRSIVVVYILLFLLKSLYMALIEKTNLGNQLKNRLNNTTDDEPIRSICITFTVITLVNSIMMVVGIDTPKVGTFAYIHMMTRFFIIVTIMVLIMFKESLQWIKNISFKDGKNRFINYSKKHTISSISVLFTVFTVIYCSIIIIVSGVVNPVGGVNFYITLLVSLLIITLITFAFNASNKTSQS